MVWKLWLLLFMFDVLGWHIMHCAHCNNFSLFQTILAFIKWKKNWSIFYFVSQKVWVANSLILNSTILESQVHENFKILCHFFCSIYFHFDLFWYQCVSLWQKAATFLLIDRKKFWPRGSERLLKMYLSKASDAPHPKLFLNLLSSNFF